MPGERRNIAGRLAWVHRSYAWSLLLLFASGLLLYLPSLRAPLAPYRVPLERFHIAAGVVQAAFIGVYLAHAARHWRSLGKWLGKRINTAIALVLAIGWTASGVVLWWERALLPFAHAALVLHDVFTWIGIPYLAAHAVMRWRRIDLALPWARARVEHPVAGMQNPVAVYHKNRARERRRELLSTAGGLVVIGSFAGLAWWLRRTGGFAAAGKEPVVPYDPLPQPGPLSDPPVGGGARGRFRIYNVARRPFFFDQEKWRLEVKGLVERPISLRWPEVERLPRSVWVRDFHCVSGWSVYGVTWEGVPLSYLLDMAGLLPQATHIKFISYDGVYTDSLTVEQSYLNDTFIAVLKDGRPLTHEEGGPVRLVTPRMFAYKSVKWLTGIEAIDSEHIGFWERLGYDTNAWLPGVPREGDLPPIPQDRRRS